MRSQVDGLPGDRSCVAQVDGTDERLARQCGTMTRLDQFRGGEPAGRVLLGNELVFPLAFPKPRLEVAMWGDDCDIGDWIDGENFLDVLVQPRNIPGDDT